MGCDANRREKTWLKYFRDEHKGTKVVVRGEELMLYDPESEQRLITRRRYTVVGGRIYLMGT